MHISSQFDSGNIRVIQADNANDIVLTINKDNQSDFYQTVFWTKRQFQHDGFLLFVVKNNRVSMHFHVVVKVLCVCLYFRALRS